MKSFRQSIVRKMFEGEIFIKTLPTTPLQMFCKIVFNFQVNVKSILDPEIPDDRYDLGGSGRIMAIVFCIP